MISYSVLVQSSKKWLFTLQIVLLCKTYGEPEYTEFDDKVFSDLLSSDRPVDRTANWPGSKGHPTAVISIQIDEEGCSLYIMEHEKD